MSKHANSHENDAEHHLYQIYDAERQGVFKYGICGKPLNKDGTSPRANEQVTLFNRVVGWMRFFAEILMTGIPAAGNAPKKSKTNLSKRTSGGMDTSLREIWSDIF